MSPALINILKTVAKALKDADLGWPEEDDEFFDLARLVYDELVKAGCTVTFYDRNADPWSMHKNKKYPYDPQPDHTYKYEYEWPKHDKRKPYPPDKGDNTWNQQPPKK